MTVVSKNVYFDALSYIVDKYNNIYDTTIIKKPIDVKSNSCAEYNVESIDKGPKLKKSDHFRISKYKNIFAEGYAPNWSEDVFVINKIKNTVPWTYGIVIVMVKKLLEPEKECQRAN